MESILKDAANASLPKVRTGRKRLFCDRELSDVTARNKHACMV